MRRPGMQERLIVSATPGLVDVPTDCDAVAQNEFGELVTRATGYSASRLTRAVKTVGSRVAAGTIRDRTAG